MVRLIISLLIVAIFPGTAAVADTGTAIKIIHAGTLLSHPGDRPLTSQSIIISGDKIVDVKSGFIPATGNLYGAEVIDLTDKFVLPGLLDLHVHLSFQLNGLKTKGGAWGISDSAVRLSAADAAINAVIYARRTLDAGFTTVRDLGARGELADAAFAVRDAVKLGKVPGPRILTAGAYISATSGHGDLEGLREDVTQLLNKPNICDGVPECIKAVRTQVRQGADVIKFMATGGGGETNGGPDAAPEFFPQEIKAIVDTAHSYNLKAAAHAHGTAGIIAALEANADSIEHGTFLNDNAIRLFKNKEAVLVPTLAVSDKLLQVAQKQGPDALNKAKARIDRKHKDIYRAWSKGVKLALGSDAGIIAHSDNGKELEHLVKTGIPTSAAIKIATVNSAELIGMSESIGTIEKGKFADIIATSASPLDDINELQRVQFVMKEGHIYKREP